MMDNSLQSTQKQFFSLNTREDVAFLLGITEIELNAILYMKGIRRYKQFSVPKKNGTERIILSPIYKLKSIQRTLNDILQCIYKPKKCVHGFTKDRSILTNARIHLKKKYILNIDIEDFFPSINFGRVRGLFMAKPYGLSPEVATILAQICCYDNQLPQGAPTSPIISNMICSRLDNRLSDLARDNQCIYTRYADDIVISCHKYIFPRNIAYYDNNSVILSDNLIEIVKSNGFKIHPKKILLRSHRTKQIVTGVKVNRIPNLEKKVSNQIRAMLHAWKKFGEQKAQDEFLDKYYKKYRNPFRKKPVIFRRVLLGKINYFGMIKSNTSKLYRKYYKLYCELAGMENKYLETEKINIIDHIIFTEGKTDWKHLKAAFKALKNQGLYEGININFEEYENMEAGSKRMSQKCEHFSQTSNNNRKIFIFDRDESQIIIKMSNVDGSPRNWGNNVFSLVIPTPSHRIDNEDKICIELYYTDKDICVSDEKNRRLYLSSEFNDQSSRNIANPEISTKYKVNSRELNILDNDVFDNEHKNIAMSKEAFARNILDGNGDFAGVDFSEFQIIFDLIIDLLR